MLTGCMLGSINRTNHNKMASVHIGGEDGHRIVQSNRCGLMFCDFKGTSQFDHNIVVSLNLSTHSGISELPNGDLWKKDFIGIFI